MASNVIRDSPFSSNQPVNLAHDNCIKIIIKKIKKTYRDVDKIKINKNIRPCDSNKATESWNIRYICRYINAVAVTVNLTRKSDTNYTYPQRLTSTANPPQPPPPSAKFWERS